MNLQHCNNVYPTRTKSAVLVKLSNIVIYFFLFVYFFCTFKSSLNNFSVCVNLMFEINLFQKCFDNMILGNTEEVVKKIIRS